MPQPDRNGGANLHSSELAAVDRNRPGNSVPGSLPKGAI
jgi:hypothetical protein